MFDKGYRNDKKFVKCAQPVGDTMGRFHPHGDSSIYGALVWLSQKWNMRYPLIDFHGNNGSRDGDSPAAYRYTECKLSKAGEEMLAEIKSQLELEGYSPCSFIHPLVFPFSIEI
jgi:DNA gyrase subunit A